MDDSLNKSDQGQLSSSSWDTGHEANVDSPDQGDHAFLEKEGQLTGSSMNIEHEVNVSSSHQEQFTMKIQGQGTDDSVNRLVQAINALLNREGHIRDSSLNKGNHGDHFTLTLKIRGFPAFLNRAAQEIVALIGREGQITESFLNIKVSMFYVSPNTGGLL